MSLNLSCQLTHIQDSCSLKKERTALSIGVRTGFSPPFFNLSLNNNPHLVTSVISAINHFYGCSRSINGTHSEMCENLIDFDKTLENVSWVGVIISWEMKMDAVIWTVITAWPLLPLLGGKYLQMVTSVVANLETGKLHPVGFGSEYKLARAIQPPSSSHFPVSFCFLQMTVRELNDLKKSS